MPDLSVQLYTVRDALAEDYDKTLAALAGFGFTAVEPFQLDGFADDLRRGLPAHGLSAPTAHVGLLNGDQDAIFALATELGIGTLIDPHVDQARWQTADDVAQIAAELNAAAAAAADHGLEGRLPQPPLRAGVHDRRPARPGGVRRSAGPGGRPGSRHLLGLRGRCRRAGPAAAAR